ncbi:hypothetical protein GCM10022247_37550 [Allokutzneria multivorans]|uniref:Uncharacterized protein n=1 Tax=Allokutzneria multivorans TaxID=1142134 RepID=A0ABP7SH18_9PSEU
MIVTALLLVPITVLTLAVVFTRSPARRAAALEALRILTGSEKERPGSPRG